MKKELFIILFVFIASFTLGIPPYLASVQLYKNGSSGSSIGTPIGVINFTQYSSSGPVLIVGIITEMPQGEANLYGFHIHEFGLISNGCKAAGGHYNPLNKTHGGPNDATRHVGDLGNIVRLSNNSAYVNFTDSIIQLVGPLSIVGRTLVLHDGTDDLGKGNNSASLITGNAGNRFACGVIGIVSDYAPAKSSVLSYSAAFLTFFCAIGIFIM